MDSPSDLFCQQSSQMCPFGLYRSPMGNTHSGPRYPRGSPPSYPLISPLLHPNSASQTWGGYRHRHSFFQGPPLSREDEEAGEEEEEVLGRRAAAAGVTPLSQLLPGATRRGGVPEPGDWSQDILRVKRLRMDRMIRKEGEMEEEEEEEEEEEDEERGRRRSTPRTGRGGGQERRKGSREGRLRQRQELKLQLEETRGRLLELQRKVWRAYGEQQTQEEERRGGEGGEEGGAGVDEAAELFSEEEGDDPVFRSGDSPPRRAPGKSEPRGRSGSAEVFPDGTLDIDLGLGEGGVWLGCGLVRGEWESLGGGQKFAQALKQELGSAVARVIDRVVRLYAQSAPPPPSALALDRQDRRSLGPVAEDKRRADGAAHALEQAEALSLVTKRAQDKRRAPLSQNVHRNPLLPQPHPSLRPLPQNLLAPRNKDPFMHAYPPNPPPVPLPLLHYTMQHLFARSLSSLPLHKDCLSSEPFLEFRSHTPSFPPLPLMGQLDPPLSSSDRGRDGGMRGGGLGGADGGDAALYLGAGSSQEGLSPCHLKKAKLMFFYARYPSSNTLKTYFPDVKFNRCVTSQLIKWFSNFREFFYIQMERFARQAARDGVTGAREGALRLGRDSELYRILNMHYNKSNDYQVPDRFVEISELALREFFTAIQSGRDADPCWKKSIYKIICKLDSPVPDSFRLPGCPMDTHRSI